jgi:formylglycine-generating enzyme required for sulfatase activity/tRNA A-37 threonylcarbamoyl transferase component Bud32
MVPRVGGYQLTAMSYDDCGTAPLTQADRVDRLCDEFEREWLAGNEPSLHSFLSRAPEADRPMMFRELLLVEVEYHGEAWGQPLVAKYREEFPEFAAIIEELGLTAMSESIFARHREARVIDGAFAGKGARISHFELLEQIGTGAAADVWTARDHRLERIVAIKLPRTQGRSEADVHRFLREARTGARLRHPTIVSVHSVEREQETPYIVTEYISGCDLRQRLANGPMTFHAAAEVCAKVADGLHYAHAHGVIHRDLKPANILVDEEGQPHIADFGLAKWHEDATGLTLEGELLGTPAYMSPEQASGRAAHVDCRTDVYSLGIILYEMLTGHCPYHGSAAAVIRAISEEPPPSPKQANKRVPTDLATICLKATAKSPHERYASAEELAADLWRFVHGEAIHARPASRAKAALRWSRRRAAALIAATLSLAALGLLSHTSELAKQNQALLGLRTVSLATEPAGAKVALYPLNKTTGEYELGGRIVATGVSPVQVELVPGDYLVVAVVEDGRFHEVLRHVPGNSEQLAGAYYHRSWKEDADGVVALPRIEIPEQSITSGMVFVDGAADFQMGIEGSTVLPAHRRATRSFYIDPAEFTFADYRRIVGKRAGDPPLVGDQPTEEIAMPVTYHQAVAYAEASGKRLPTETEYELVATNRGRTRFPWGNAAPDTVGAELAMVGHPIFDRSATVPHVYGLCSSVAEWTSSWPLPYPPNPVPVDFLTASERRVVRGGTLATIRGGAKVTKEVRDPRQRVDILCHEKHPGLGFRCVRSARPLVDYADFHRPVTAMR